MEVEGTPVTVANADGTWSAFEHMCPHQATPLGGLPLMRGVLLRCPEHGSTFDVTTGQCVLPSRRRLDRHPAYVPREVVDDVVQVSLR